MTAEMAERREKLVFAAMFLEVDAFPIVFAMTMIVYLYQ